MSLANSEYTKAHMFSWLGNIKYVELKISNKKIDLKIEKKIKNSEIAASNLVMNLFINQNRIDDVVENHKRHYLLIIKGERRLLELANKLRISKSITDWFNLVHFLNLIYFRIVFYEKLKQFCLLHYQVILLQQLLH